MLSVMLSLLMFLSPIRPSSRTRECYMRSASGVAEVRERAKLRACNTTTLRSPASPTPAFWSSSITPEANTTFSFDLHHRVSLDPDFVYPADITTNVEVLSGGTTSIGTFTIVEHDQVRRRF